MSGSAARGVVSVSIDAQSGSTTIVDLLDRFHKHRLVASWFFMDPTGTSLAANRITRDMPGQEVGLLAALPASGIDVSRGEMIRTIVRQLQSAQEADIAITSLGISGGWDARNVDLLTKHGISIIRTSDTTAGIHAPARQGISKLDGAGARAICHGLWQVPVTVALHGGSWFANRVQLARLLRSINRAASGGVMCHVQIGADALAAGDLRQALRSIDRCLRHLERLQREGRIAVETLRATAGRLLPKRSVAAHSICAA